MRPPIVDLALSSLVHDREGQLALTREGLLAIRAALEATPDAELADAVIGLADTAGLLDAELSSPAAARALVAVLQSCAGRARGCLSAADERGRDAMRKVAGRFSAFTAAQAAAGTRPSAPSIPVRSLAPALLATPRRRRAAGPCRQPPRY